MVVMVVTAAGAVRAVVVVVFPVVVMLLPLVVAALVALLVVMVLMVVIVMSMLVVVFMVMVVLMGLLHQFFKLVGHGGALNGGEDGLSLQAVPGGGEDGGGRVLLPNEGHHALQLLLAQFLSPGQDDTAGGLDLIVIKFRDIFHVAFGLDGIHHRDEAVQRQLGHRLHRISHGGDHVAEFGHSRGLNEDPGGLVLFIDLPQRLGKIPYQGTTDAPRG